MWVFPGWKGAWINPEVCFHFLLTLEGMLWGSDSTWNSQSGKSTLIPRAPWSLSRRDKSGRMIFLCKHLAQRGTSLLGESWGMVTCKTAPRIYLDAASLTILKKQRYSGVTNPMVQVCHPTKTPGRAEQFPGSRVVTFMGSLCSSGSVKGLQQWQKKDSDLNSGITPKLGEAQHPSRAAWLPQFSFMINSEALCWQENTGWG